MVGTTVSSLTHLSLVTAGSKDAAASAPDAKAVAVQRKSLDDMITTLSSFSKMNSVRGEDLAAMQYHDKKTKIQALRIEIKEQLSTRSSVGCLGPGAFFGEINEDVKMSYSAASPFARTTKRNAVRIGLLSTTFRFCGADTCIVAV